MHLSQVKDRSGALIVVLRDGADAHALPGVESSYALAMQAASEGRSLSSLLADLPRGETVDLERVAREGAFALPMSHPDSAHMYLCGTGLTHLGSASTRDAMHGGGTETVTDSMKMFRLGIEGGKPATGEVGAQPEWFYKGNGSTAVPCGDALTSPAFALDGGEEPEIAGFYVIAPDGAPMRVGFSLCNEFSDHVTERLNYLFLAHSKLRPASFGPELRLGDLPRDIRGRSRILRDGKAIFDQPFLSGEENMSHSIANLEHHHFKYATFRQPGDLHLHMFGTATLSCGAGLQTQPGDTFEISAPDFGLPLVNTFAVEDAAVRPVNVAAL